ncbi:MFS transporter, partial [Staphylococcus epidermidis]
KYYHKDIHLEGTLEDDLNSDVTSPHNSWTDLFKPRYIKRIILATAISTLQGMQYYGVGLYIPIIATYLISKDKIGVLLGTAIVN